MSPEAPYQPLADEQVRARWLSEYGNYQNAGAAFERLVATYRGPDRYYHTIEHGMEVATSARSLSADLSEDDRDSVCLAAWCHDAHYDFLAKDNEERSAAFAVELAYLLGFSRHRADLLYGLVLASSHTLEPANKLAMIMCDADLAVLGKTWSGYCYDVANIRAELRISDQTEWRTARIKMLSFFETKRPLYHLEQAATAWLDTAVANRQHEMQLLLAN